MEKPPVKGPCETVGVFSPENIFPIFLLLLLAVALLLAYEVARPFLNTLVLATVLAIICSPVHLRLTQVFRGRRGFAAGVTVMVATVAIILPLSFFLFGLLGQGRQTLTDLSVWMVQNDIADFFRLDMLRPYLDWVEAHLPFIHLEGLNLEGQLLSFTSEFTSNLVRFGRNLAANAAMLVFHFVLMMGLLFYFVRDGHAIIARIKYLCPMRSEQEELIIETLHRVSRSVLLGSLLVAVLQGLAGGIGLAICGIPGFFWGTIMGMASLIPVVGTGLVWVPACAYLFVSGHWGWALFLALYCGVFVVGIDTFLRPVLLQEASNVPAFYIFLSILGGLAAFGPLGLLYGPLVLCFVMVMLEIYGEEYKDILDDDA